MSPIRTYALNDLCTVACDADSPLGRLVDLHLDYFPSAELPVGNRADVALHSTLPTLSDNHRLTAEGIAVDGNTVFVKEHDVALRYSESAVDVYSRRGLTPHLFVQLFGFTRQFVLAHAAAITYRGQGILLPAWGGVGKTSLVMSLMSRDDVQLFGDDMIFLCGRKGIQCYPIPFSVYHYHREIFPELFRHRSRRRGISGATHLGILKALRPLGQAVVAAVPQAEEFAKRYGRGYRPVPVLEVFDRAKIASRASVNHAVCLQRHTGADFELHSVDKEYVARSLLGVLHYEFSCSPLLQLAVILGATALLDLAEYFARAKQIIVDTLEDAQCSELLIPQRARPSDIGEAFLTKVLNHCGGGS